MTSTHYVTISSDLLTAEISCLGAELQRFTTADGLDLLWNGEPAVWQGKAPVLFPVIGLLEGGSYRLADLSYDMPKHGFARHSLFDIVETSPSRATLRLAASPETFTIYPFDFHLDIIFELVNSTLTLSAEIANRSCQPMPASFGFHPALRWPLPFRQARDDHRIRFGQSEPAPVRRINADGLLKPAPVATPVAGDTLMLRDDLFIDDALIFDNLLSRCAFYGASAGPQIKVEFDDFPTLGIWTKPNADFICIEPWHGFSDPIGYGGDIRDKPGIFEVAPSKVRRLSMTLSLEDASSA